MKRILSIDQSFTCTGFCVADVDKDTIRVVHSGTIVTDKEKSIYERSMIISNHLSFLCEDFGIEEVVLEQLAFGGVGNATRNLAGLLFVIVTKLLSTHFDMDMDKITLVAPTSAKKCFTGNGKATKVDMYNSLPEDVKEHFSKKYLKTKGLYDVTDSYAFLKYYQTKKM